MKKADLSGVKNGIVCFTFDDRNFDGWLSALPIFEKYKSHASFFVSGVIDDKTVEVMTALAEKGHTVGLHTLNHIDAPQYISQNGTEAYFENQIAPQLLKCRQSGIEINSFSYPNNARNNETDEFLSGYFNRFRAGSRDVSDSEIYRPISELSEKKVMHGIGIGKHYNTTEGELLKKLEYVAKTNTCVTFFSHNIAPNADFIHIPTELLESCLKKANELGVMILGFDEL